MPCNGLGLIFDDFLNCFQLKIGYDEIQSGICSETWTMVGLSPTDGVLKVANVIGTGFTIYKTYEISVDLKLRSNNANAFTNVFQFTVTVQSQSFPDNCPFWAVQYNFNFTFKC